MLFMFQVSVDEKNEEKYHVAFMWKEVANQSFIGNWNMIVTITIWYKFEKDVCRMAASLSRHLLVNDGSWNSGNSISEGYAYATLVHRKGRDLADNIFYSFLVETLVF